MRVETETALFKKARAGDREAFDRLQEALEPQVRRFVARLIGHSEREEEVSQDAFLALFTNLDRLESEEHVRPFLFRIVRNLCYDELRRRKRFRHVRLQDVADEAMFPDGRMRSPPDEEVHWLLVMSRVKEAIDRLPEPQRQALMLYFEEEFTYEQIASATGVDIGTVKSRLYYGRQRLVALLPPDVLASLKRKGD